MKINQFWLRFLGIMGILGGLVLFVGDMLFYYDDTSLNIIENMSKASNNRIILSTISALLASWFYLLGLIPVYYAFEKASKKSRIIISLSFGAILVSYGVIHGAYVAIATTAKLAYQNNLDIEETTALAIKANQVLRNFIYPIFALLSYYFIKNVWQKKSLYPRWMILFFPLFSFLIKDLIFYGLSGQAKLIITGGYLNIMLIIFFTASTVALWNRKTQ